MLRERVPVWWLAREEGLVCMCMCLTLTGRRQERMEWKGESAELLEGEQEWGTRADRQALGINRMAEQELSESRPRHVSCVVS